MDPQDLPRGPDHHGEPEVAGVPGLDPDAGPSLVLAGVDGPHPLGPATIDSDADGAPDTAVVPTPDLVSLATDLDRDGDVDVLTSVASDGAARTVTITGPWTARDAPGSDGWDEGWDAPAPPAATLDPATGAWTRSP